MLRKTFVTTESVAGLLKYAEPRIQRTLNVEHVKHMVEDQKAEYAKHKCFSMMQSITVAYVMEEKEFYVLDGHHRLKAFQELQKLGLPVEDIVLPVVQYYVHDQTEMIAYYTRINKNMPIHPLETTTTYVDFEKILVERFARTFATYVKHHGGAVKCPNISLQDLKKHLLAREVGNKLKNANTSIDDFWSILLNFNGYVGKDLKGKQLDASIKKRIDDCEAKSHGGAVCYLGIWRKFEWLDILLAHVENNESFQVCCEKVCCSSTSGMPSMKRKRVPAIVRLEVWKKLNNNICDIGQCFVCEHDLLFQDMECGHIHAHALGGSDSVDNMMPVCKTCNRDMGIMHMLEYKTLVLNMLGA